MHFLTHTHRSHMKMLWKVSGKRSSYSLSSVRHSTVSERAVTLAVLISVLRRACVHRRGYQIFFLTLSLFRQRWKLCNVVKHPIKWSLMHDMKIIISSLESSPVPQSNRLVRGPWYSPHVRPHVWSLLPKSTMVIIMMVLANVLVIKTKIQSTSPSARR